MSADNSQSKAVMLPTFSGKAKDYAVFWPRFLAYATLKGFADVLTRATTQLPVDPKALDADAEIRKVQKMALQQNKLAMASFTMAFTTGELMEYIEDAKSEEYTGGRADLVTEGLIRKYRPTDRISGVEAEKELMKLKMVKDEDPDKYFRKLAVLKNRYRSNGNTSDEQKLIAATLAKAPATYGSVLTSVLREKGNALKIIDIQEAMKEHWRIRHNLLSEDVEEHESDDDDDEVKETALNAATNIRCYNCGQVGHKKSKCPKRKNSNKTNSNGNGNGKKKAKFTGSCHNCGKVGHKVTDCWLLDKNKDKRPNNWKGSESGNTAANGDIEYCMMCADGDEYDNNDAKKDETEEIETESNNNDNASTNNESVEENKEKKQNKNNNNCDEHENDDGHPKSMCMSNDEAKEKRRAARMPSEVNTKNSIDEVNDAVESMTMNETRYRDATEGDEYARTMAQYPGQVYDRDPYETDTNQSVGTSNSELVDTDGNMIPEPLRELTAREMEELIGDDSISEELLNDVLEWRNRFNLMIGTNTYNDNNENRKEQERNDDDDANDDVNSNDDGSSRVWLQVNFKNKVRPSSDNRA